MSLVIAAFTDQFGVLACDGRVTGPGNQIYYEDFKKYYQINDNVVVGFAGQANRCLIMIDYLKEQLDKQNGSNISVVDVYKQLQLPKVQADSLNTDVNMKFLILGKNRNSKVRCFAVDYHGNYDASPIKMPPSGDLSFAFAYNGSYGDYEEIVTSCIIEARNSIKSPIDAVVQGLTKAIQKVAIFDMSINDHVSTVVIR